MHIGSYLVIFYLFFIFITCKNKEDFFIKGFVFYIIFAVFINIGCFAIVGKNEIFNSHVIFFFLIIVGYFYFGKNIKISRKLSLIIFAFIISVSISIFLLVFYPPSFGVVPDQISFQINKKVFPEFNYTIFKRYILILLFLLFVILFKSFINEERWRRISNSIIKIGKINLLYCYIEFLYNTIFKNDKLRCLLILIFGGEDTTRVNFLFKRGIFFTLSGGTREPNNLTVALFLFMFILFASDRNNREKALYFLATIPIFFISGSFAGIINIFILGFFFFLMIDLQPIIRFFYVFSSIILLYFTIKKVDFSYYLFRMNNIIEGREARVITILDNLNIFLKRPLFGVGIGTTVSYGFVSSALSNIGLFGFILWICVIFYGIKNIDFKKIIILFVLLFFFTINGGIDYLYFAFPLLFIYSLNYNSLTEEHTKNLIKRGFSFEKEIKFN